MTARILFSVPNALDTKRPLPLPLGPSLLQFLIVMTAFFGGMLVGGVDLSLDRGPDDLIHFEIMCVVLFVAVTFRPGGRMSTYWLWTMNRMSLLRVIGRLSWGWRPHYQARNAALPGGKPRRGAVMISAPWAHALYANARVLEDGVVDVSGLMLPRPFRLIASLLLGKPAYRKLIDVGIAALADLEDPENQERLRRVRTSFWFRLNHRCSAHAMVRPLDPESIAYCAGPEESAARALAQGQLGQQTGLIGRDNYLVVAAPTVWLLERQVKHARSVLLEHGRDARVLDSNEVNRLLDREWGSSRRKPLEITPGYVRYGNRGWISYLVTRLERNVPLDWTLSFLDGSLPFARIGLFQRPVRPGGPFGALAQLTWRTVSWRAAGLGFDSKRYENALTDAEQVQTDIREPSGSLHKWGLVITVPEDQKEEVEKQLKARYLPYDGGWRPAFSSQDAAARSSLPLGLDGYVDMAHTSSSTLALSTPWTGTGIRRPPIDGKPTDVLLGYGLATAEPICWAPFDQKTQEAWNLFVWGMMGSGKTTVMQMLARRICQPHPKHYLADLKPRGLFIDHKSSLEYGGLVTDLGGKYIVANDWSDVRSINVEQAALGINVSRIHPRKRGTFVYDLTRHMWDQISKRPTSEPWPGVVGMDEMHMLALTEDGRWVISELGKMGRDAWMVVMFGTQDMDDTLRKDETSGVGTDGLVAAAVKNAPTKIALRQPTLSRRLLLERLQMSHADVDFLTYMGGEDGGEVRSSRGKCLVWAHGRKAPTQIVPLGREPEIFAQDPQNRLANLKTGATVYVNSDDPANGSFTDGLVGGFLGSGASERSRRRTRAAAYRRRRIASSSTGTVPGSAAGAGRDRLRLGSDLAVQPPLESDA